MLFIDQVMFIIYSSDCQPGIREPQGVREWCAGVARDIRQDSEITGNFCLLREFGRVRGARTFVVGSRGRAIQTV